MAELTLALLLSLRRWTATIDLKFGCSNLRADLPLRPSSLSRTTQACWPTSQSFFPSPQYYHSCPLDGPNRIHRISYEKSKAGCEEVQSCVDSRPGARLVIPHCAESEVMAFTTANANIVARMHAMKDREDSVA